MMRVFHTLEFRIYSKLMCRCVAFGLMALFLLVGVRAQKVPAQYREWLQKDAAYIITNEEKSAFLKLADDTAREKFIEHFWAIRNTTPESSTNEYKDEHYRRIAFADARYAEGNREGWRTDRGRIYITLGEPKQVEHHLSEGNMRPLEIWFYSSDSPALPPYFYIMFYQREAGGDFRIYSPYFDGPNKLVSTMRGTEETGDKGAALHLIIDSAGSQVAKVALSLLPDEPVDLRQGTTSLESDVMLSTIHDLANNVFVKEQLNRRREILEGVRSQIITEGSNLDILTVTLRDGTGQPRTHYMLRAHAPSDISIEKRDDGRYYYSVGCRVLVFGENNKLIFTQEKTVTGKVDEKEFDRIKGETMAYEGWLPLAPGKYRLEFLLTDWTKREGKRAERTVEVPTLPTTGMVVSGILPFTQMRSVDSSLADVAPFSVGGEKFSPLSTQQLAFPMSGNLNVAYQLWEPPGNPETLQGQKLQVSYAFGRPAAPGSTRTITDEVAREQFDRFGSLINGKKLTLGQLEYGNYLLTVSVAAAGVQQQAFTTMHFRVLDTNIPSESWEIWDPAIHDDMQAGVMDTQRALTFLNLGDNRECALWLQSALAKNRGNESAREKLVDLFFSQGKFKEAAALADISPITTETPVQSILRMAESRNKIGSVDKAIELLEDGLSAKGQSSPMLIALASYYRELGNTKKADELTKQGDAVAKKQGSASN
jgi:GWxTD domain-containing protein